MIRSKFICTAFFFLIIFAGCSIKETAKNGSDEDALKERIMGYINYRIKDDLLKSYEYEDPLYRKQATLSQYIGKLTSGASKWLSADINSVRVEGNQAYVTMKVRIKALLTGVLPTPPTVVESDTMIKSLWIKQDGVWYHVFGAKGLDSSEDEHRLKPTERSAKEFTKDV